MCSLDGIENHSFLKVPYMLGQNVQDPCCSHPEVCSYTCLLISATNKQCFSCGHGFVMSVSPYTNNGFVNDISESNSKDATRLT